MKKNLTEIVFILDKSGSMYGLEKDTIGGCNSFIEKQKKEEGEALISIVLFSDSSEILADRVSLTEIRPLTEKDYCPSGCTALLDAIGDTVKNISLIQKHIREEDCPEKTIFIIMTDGQENSSRSYSYEQIKAMITEAQEKKKWEFLFLGANMDAIAAAARFGIHEDHAVRFENDSRGVQLNYKVLSDAVACARSCEAPQMAGSWKERIETDYKSRKRRR